MISLRLWWESIYLFVGSNHFWSWGSSQFFTPKLQFYMSVINLASSFSSATFQCMFTFLFKTRLSTYSLVEVSEIEAGGCFGDFPRVECKVSVNLHTYLKTLCTILTCRYVVCTYVKCSLSTSIISLLQI